MGLLIPWLCGASLLSRHWAQLFYRMKIVHLPVLPETTALPGGSIQGTLHSGCVLQGWHMEAADAYETSVNFYQTTRHHIAEQYMPQSLRYFFLSFCFHLFQLCNIACELAINNRLSASTFTPDSITYGIWTLCWWPLLSTSLVITAREWWRTGGL